MPNWKTLEREALAERLRREWLPDGLHHIHLTSGGSEPIAAAGLDVMFRTFGAMPSACAAAGKVLEIMTREQLVARAATQNERLATQLHAGLGQHPNAAEIRGRGLLQAIEIVRDRDTLEQFDPSERITQRIVCLGPPPSG